MHLKTFLVPYIAFLCVLLAGRGLGIKFDIQLEMEPFCPHTVIRQTSKTTDLSLGEYNPPSLGSCPLSAEIKKWVVECFFLSVP